MKIQEQVFLVTGAASGLGAATAKMLVKAGGYVLMADINEDVGTKIAAELGERAQFVKTDVTSEESGYEAFKVAASMGPVRGVINCAGIAPAKKVLGKEGVHSLEDFMHTVTINLAGTFNMSRLGAKIISDSKALVDGERGVIVMTASVAAFDGQIGQTAYAASKGAVAAMTLPMARELNRYGIRVMTIAPGIMETPMLLGMPIEVQESLGRMVPFPARLGKPEEYASLVSHIIQNNYLNGDVIRLDGAIRMAAK